jgi:hypothetical protein
MTIIRVLTALLWLYALTGYAQSVTPAQLVGTWIGESTEGDIGWVRPLTWRMTFQTDSTVQLASMSERGMSRTVKWWIKDRAVQMDTVTFKANQWRLTGDQLFINGWEPQRYRLLKPVPMDSVSIWKIIRNHTWSTDSLSYSLFEDGSVCLENLKTGDVALHYWHLVPVEESLFLIVKGTQMERDFGPHYPLQIVQQTLNALTVRGWNGKRWGDFTLVRTANLKPDQTCRPSGFQLCNTFLAPGDQKYPYYEYKKGRLGAIRRIVAREFQPVAGVKQSGLVRFRFVVNCQGKAGMFEMLTLDENYERCQFDTRITNQLRRICQEKIIDWEPGAGTGTDKDNVYDTVCLLTFRLKDGQIAEIFP